MKLERKRLYISKKTGLKERIKIINSAAAEKYNTVIFSLDDDFFKNRNRNQKYIKLLKHYSFNIEAGGRDFPLFIPKWLYLFRRDIFRMEEGKRKMNHHFCTTNPQTISYIKERAAFLFSRSINEVTPTRIFHLLPDEGHENTWCSCPACRAFSPAEQNLITVNTAADALANLDPEAKILYLDLGTEAEAPGITPRKNMLAEKSTIFCVTS